MTATHFLRHLALAYNHFHPVDEHRQFAKKMQSFEKHLVKGELLAKLASIEARAELRGITYGELATLKKRISKIRSQVERN